MMCCAAKNVVAVSVVRSLLRPLDYKLLDSCELHTVVDADADVVDCLMSSRVWRTVSTSSD